MGVRLSAFPRIVKLLFPPRPEGFIPLSLYVLSEFFRRPGSKTMEESFHFAEGELVDEEHVMNTVDPGMFPNFRSPGFHREGDTVHLVLRYVFCHMPYSSLPQLMHSFVI